jgi:hypothetical protein
VKLKLTPFSVFALFLGVSAAWIFTQKNAARDAVTAQPLHAATDQPRPRVIPPTAQRIVAPLPAGTWNERDLVLNNNSAPSDDRSNVLQGRNCRGRGGGRIATSGGACWLD